MLLGKLPPIEILESHNLNQFLDVSVALKLVMVLIIIVFVMQSLNLIVTVFTYILLSFVMVNMFVKCLLIFRPLCIFEKINNRFCHNFFFIHISHRFQNIKTNCE